MFLPLHWRRLQDPKIAEIPLLCELLVDVDAFSGSVEQSALEFANHITEATNLAGDNPEGTKMFLVAGKLKGSVLVWYKGWKMTYVDKTLQDMLEALQMTFPEAQRRYTWSKTLLMRRQKVDETVLEYVTDIQRLGAT